jgi:hypothetical protein
MANGGENGREELFLKGMKKYIVTVTFIAHQLGDLVCNM